MRCLTMGYGIGWRRVARFEESRVKTETGGRERGLWADLGLAAKGLDRRWGEQADDSKGRRHLGDGALIRTREPWAAGEMRRGRRAANGREGLKYGIIPALSGIEHHGSAWIETGDRDALRSPYVELRR